MKYLGSRKIKAFSKPRGNISICVIYDLLHELIFKK